ncbi:MAG: hypothetical protein M4D80_36330, partial [Myxococcota bacterium]|nr:hypothetical protein [Myxococcota bacterium]
MMRVAFVLAVILALGACGDNAVDAAGGGATITTRVVASLPPDGVMSMDLAAVDERRIVLARVDRTDGAFCPDCVGLDPSECPALCERSLVSASVLDLATGALTPSQPVATVFPASFDHSVDQVEVVALGGDRVGVAWLDCDNARCGGLFAKRSCTAMYTTLDLATGAVGAPVTLYTGWFGDLSLAFDQTSRRMLAVIAKDLVFGGGVFRAIYDDAARAVSPWQPLGSPAARSPALLASGGHMTVVADDWSPNAAPRT